MKTSIWSAVTCHRFCRFGDLSPKQGRVQRPEIVRRLPPFNGDKSPAESADKSAHSTEFEASPRWEISRLTARLLSFFVVVALSGCILPGGLRVVGRYDIQGRLLDADGQGVPGKSIVLLQPHAGKTDTKMVNALATGSELDGASNQTAALTTNSRGEFDYQFQGFGHCHPFWLFPPLFELPPYLNGDTRHGRFFLLKIPDIEGRIYEIEVRQPKPRIRVVDPASAKLRRIKAGDETVTGSTVLTERVQLPAYTQLVSKVLLEFKRPKPRE